jgi:hypothetical protein
LDKDFLLPPFLVKGGAKKRRCKKVLTNLGSSSLILLTPRFASFSKNFGKTSSDRSKIFGVATPNHSFSPQIYTKTFLRRQAQQRPNH